MSKFQLFWMYLRKYWFSYFIAVSTAIVTNALAVTIPDYLERGIEILSSENNNKLQALIYPSSVILVLAAVMLFARFVSRFIFYNSSRSIECDIKNDMLKRLLHLDRGYYEKNPPGAIISRINNDITGVRLLYGFGLLQLVNLLSALSLAPYKMWLISPSLTYACLILSITTFIVLRFGLKILHGMLLRQTDILRALSAYISSVLGAVDVIKNYDMRRWSREEFKKRNKAWLSETTAITSRRSFLNPVLGNLEYILKILVLGLGGTFVLQSGMTIGEMTAYLAYIGILTSPFMGLSWLLNMTQQGLVGLESVSRVLEEKESSGYAEENNWTGEKTLFNQGLSVRNLSFKYSDSTENVLDNISFDLRPGESLGIFGPVGSGKTTLVHCLNRYLMAGPGQIFLDGQDIASIPYAVIRSTIRTVSQEPFLFSDTIKGNINFLANKASSDQGLDKALRAASIWDEIAHFPSGVETLVGEKGIMLSGGQKQRVSFARALISPCPILILDDVLSAVDYQTEKRLLDAIYEAPGVKARIIVSHRVKALGRADRILVLEKGRVAAVGTHDELVNRPGYYKDTWELQNMLAHEISPDEGPSE